MGRGQANDTRMRVGDGGGGYTCLKTYGDFVYLIPK